MTMTHWEDWSDEDEQPSGIGVDAPEMADRDDPVSDRIRRVQCLGCGDVVQLPRRLVRGRRRCRCQRLSVLAYGVSGYRFSALDGFDKTTKENS